MPQDNFGIMKDKEQLRNYYRMHLPLLHVRRVSRLALGPENPFALKVVTGTLDKIVNFLILIEYCGYERKCPNF